MKCSAEFQFFGKLTLSDPMLYRNDFCELLIAVDTKRAAAVPLSSTQANHTSKPGSDVSVDAS